jgi:hypothetical protein
VDTGTAKEQVQRIAASGSLLRGAGQALVDVGVRSPAPLALVRGRRGSGVGPAGVRSLSWLVMVAVGAGGGVAILWFKTVQL